VPVLVMRNVTERPEGVAAGIAALVGTDPDVIEDLAATLLASGDWSAIRRFNEQRAAGLAPHDAAHAVRSALPSTDRGAPVEAYPNPYGDGRAGERIADILVHRLTGQARRTADWPGAQVEPGGVRP
jgi:UDP-N-acetylglucosamine 2-epimerase (non-hydrolysing)